MISLMADTDSMNRSGKAVVYLPVGDTWGICCNKENLLLILLVTQTSTFPETVIGLNSMLKVCGNVNNIFFLVNTEGKKKIKPFPFHMW